MEYNKRMKEMKSWTESKDFQKDLNKHVWLNLAIFIFGVCVCKLIRRTQSKVQRNPGKLKPDQIKNQDKNLEEPQELR